MSRLQQDDRDQPDSAGQRPATAVITVLRPRPEVTGTLEDQLRRVDARLDRAMAELDLAWRAALDGAEEAAVLGRFDLPLLLRQSLTAGGKRIRPAMTQLGWSAAGGEPDTLGAEHAVTLGAALELLHTFALIHDDVMDASARRRGRPTIHVLAASLHAAADGLGDPRRFGESVAILLGDLAHAETAHLIGGLPAPLRHRWREMTIELVCGQRGDLSGSAAPAFDHAEAQRVGRLKSGCYTIRRPLELGAVAAGASAEALGRLGRFGEALGAAFALRDDALGVWGDPHVTGKPAGDDLISGKPTMIIALARQRLTGRDHELLDRVGTPALRSADVAELQAVLYRSGVHAEVERMIEAKVESALAALDTSVLRPAAVLELTRMAHRIAWRDR